MPDSTRLSDNVLPVEKYKETALKERFVRQKALTIKRSFDTSVLVIERKHTLWLRTTEVR